MCMISCFSCVLLFATPMDCSPPDSSVPGILQARILEWVSYSPPGDLPDSGIKPASPALAGGFFTIEPRGKPSGAPWLGPKVLSSQHS